MNKKVKIGSGGVISITDKQYLAAGGQAEIYVNGGKAFKIYHDPDKTMLPLSKIKELGTIGNSQVVIPKDIIYDASTGKPLGYTTDYITNAEPLLKLFTRTFKDAHNLDQSMINELIKQMQLITLDVHKSQCLIVDYNELNVLVNIGSSILTPWYIDTDSYATPTHKATAIMDSVRDRRVTVYDSKGNMHYNPDVMSDWFSFGVLAFWLYSNIHPFRGNHPKYKPKDKAQQMDDNISVFTAGVRVPPSTNNFNVIPKRHLDWFKDMFGNNQRSIPPLPDSTAPTLVPAQIITIKGTDKLNVVEVGAYTSHVQFVIQSMGVNYVVTKSHLYADKKEILGVDRKAQKVLLCPATDGTMVSATLVGETVNFADMKSGVPFGTIRSKDMFCRNNAIYTMAAGKLVENSFSCIGTKIIHRPKELENVSTLTATMWDGCILQNLLGKSYLILPYKKEASFSKYIPALDNYRIVSAKSDKNITVVIAEKGGKYDRFIIVFEKNYQSFDVRVVPDVAYDDINFCTLDNGFCILLSNDTEIEMFFNNKTIETLSNPPFDSGMSLFATPDGAFFINGNSIHQLQKK